MYFRNFLSVVATVICSTVIVYSHAEGAVCHHCEDIREYNAKYHQNYEYYDDYLKSQSGEKKGPVAENGAENTKKTSVAPASNADQMQRKHAKSLL